MDRLRVNKPRRRIQVKRGEMEKVDEVIQKEEKRGEGEAIKNNIEDVMEGSHVINRTRHSEDVNKVIEMSNTTYLQIYSPSHDVLISKSCDLKCDINCTLFSLLATVLYYLFL